MTSPDSASCACADYDGDLLIMRLPVLADPDGYQLRIDRADKCIRFSPEVLDEIRAAAVRSESDVTIIDGVLRIVGSNRMVAYRIGAIDAAGVRAERIDGD